MIQITRFKLAAALAACTMALVASSARADSLTFTLDSSQSYITLNIPNFSYSGNTINLTGENRTNGAPIGTAWSASTTTGNTAFVSGTFATTIGGGLSVASGQKVQSIDFVSGANNLNALTSGNYRPNPAAYNTLTSAYNNNSGGPGNYAATAHVILGNAGVVSFDNTKYDLGSAHLAGSNTPVNGTIPFSAGQLQAGIIDSVFSVQGFVLFIAGQVIPNASTHLSLGLTGTNAGTAAYSFTSPTNLRLTTPISIPISIDVGGGVFINGTASGRFVANAAVPEPSTLALAGLGLVSVVALVRRRRMQNS